MPRWRRILTAFLVVVGCILVPVSVLGVWTRNTLLNTDQYVETVGPLAGQSGIQQAVAARVSQQVREGTDLEQKVEDALPDRAVFLSAPIADAVQELVKRAALRVVESDRFQTLWENANRRAHTQVVALLTGDGTETVSTKEGKVVVNLGPVVDRVKQRLEGLGLDIFDDDSGQRVSRQFVLFEADTLHSLQGAVSLLDTLAIVLPILTALVFAAAIWLSGNRRRTILRSALGIVLATALVLTLFNVLRTAYIDAVTTPNLTAEAAGEAYDQVLGFLRLSLRTIFVFGLVVAIAAWVSGPSRAATWLRSGVRDIGRSDGAVGEPSPVAVFVTDHKTGIRATVVGVALLLLVVLSAPGPVAVLVIAVLVAVGLLAIELLGRGAPPPAASQPAP